MIDLKKALVCSTCKGPLIWGASLISCGRCRREFALNDGVPIMTSGNPGYEKIVSFYEEYHTERTRDVPPWMKSYWSYFKGTTLEIGCGTLVPGRSDYIGLDLTLPAITKMRAKGATGVVGSGAEVPFPDEFFETVACHDLLEHVLTEEIPKVFDEMSRVTKSRIVIMGPNYVGTNFWRSKADYRARIVGVLLGRHHKLHRLENPHISLDEEWDKDRDAVSAVNVFYVAHELEKRGFRVLVRKSWIEVNRDWLNQIPIVSLVGTFMTIIAEKNASRGP